MSVDEIPAGLPARAAAKRVLQAFVLEGRVLSETVYAPLRDAMRGSAVLLLRCPDGRGRADAVSDFFRRHDAEIVAEDQHRDIGHVLMRIEWQWSDAATGPNALCQPFAPLPENLQAQWRLSANAEHRRARNGLGIAKLRERHGAPLSSGRSLLGQIDGRGKIPTRTDAVASRGPTGHYLIGRREGEIARLHRRRSPARTGHPSACKAVRPRAHLLPAYPPRLPWQQSHGGVSAGRHRIRAWRAARVQAVRRGRMGGNARRLPTASRRPGLRNGLSHPGSDFFRGRFPFVPLRLAPSPSQP